MIRFEDLPNPKEVMFNSYFYSFYRKHIAGSILIANTNRRSRHPLSTLLKVNELYYPLEYTEHDVIILKRSMGGVFKVKANILIISIQQGNTLIRNGKYLDYFRHALQSHEHRVGYIPMGGYR